MFLQHDAVLPPRQQVDVTARSTLPGPLHLGGNQIIDSHQVRPGLYIGRTLLSTGHRDMKVRMINTTSNTQRLLSGTCIGALSPVDVVDDETGDCDSTLSDTRGARNDTAPGDVNVTQPLVDKLPEDLTAENSANG